MFRENFRGVPEETGEFSEISEGIKAVIIEKTIEKVTDAGNNMVQVKLRITEGEDKNKVIFPFPNIVFSEKMKGRNKHILKVLNQPYEGEPVIDPSEWIGQECYVRIQLKSDTFWKRVIPNVTQWLSPEQLEEEKLKAEKQGNPKAKEAKASEEIEKTSEEEEPPIPQEPSEEKEEDKNTIPF
jgi:hypothetical protein